MLGSLSIETAITFFVASVAIGVAPGPDNLFVLAQSAMHGRRAGLSVTLGLSTGLIGHTLAVALGLAALIHASETAFFGLKLVGAGYLLWLAWKAFSAGGGALSETGDAERIGYARLYVRGIAMNLTNPKVTLFFLAYLPQFVAPERGAIEWQIAALGGLFILMTLLIFGGIAILAGSVGRRLRESERVRALMNGLAGFVFIGLALKLLFSEAK